jgi:hypothetical protein
MGRLLVTIAVVVAAVGSAWAGSCIEAKGEFVGRCLLPEVTGCEQEGPRRPIDEQPFRLGQIANAMANAACEADAGFASSVKVYAFLDATQVEISTLHTEWLRTEAAAQKAVLAYAVPVQRSTPVVVRVMPVRLGNPLPVLVAVVRDAVAKPVKIEYVVRPWPDPKASVPK